MPVLSMPGLDGRSACRNPVGTRQNGTNPKGGSVTKKRSKIQQIVTPSAFRKHTSVMSIQFEMGKLATIYIDGLLEPIDGRGILLMPRARYGCNNRLLGV